MCNMKKSKKITTVIVICSMLSLCIFNGCADRSQTADGAAKVSAATISSSSNTQSTEKKTTQNKKAGDMVNQKISSNKKTGKITAKKTKTLSGLKKKVKKTIQNSGVDETNVSVSVYNLKNGKSMKLGYGSVRAASLIKLYVAGTVYEQMKKGTLKASKEEIDSLVKKMITVSDNTACNTLVKKLGRSDANAGMALVNSYCAKHGFQETSMGRLMLDFSSNQDNYTSVADCSRFLQLISKKKLTGSSKILKYMKKQTRLSKIPAGVPNGVQTANKTGELNDTENDVAIVYKKGKPYIICVMVSPVSDTASARKLITEISKVVYRNI